MDIAALLARYGQARAPRYTSYPTAVQFTPEVGETAHRAWLGSLPADEPVSLYVHVPFCRRLCWYCGCNTRVVNRPEPVSDYVGVLEKEISQVAQAIGKRLTVGSLHLGGGSPNSLELADLDRLFAALREAFELSPNATIAAELDPSQVEPVWVARARRHGLNRASLGVQDFSPDVQLAVNRLQPFEAVADAVSALRANGVASINLDLMYGLPRQTVADVIRTAELAASLEPERLAVFGYAHVPWLKAHQRLIRSEDLPPAEERLRQADAATQTLLAAGYRRIGLDHFARPDDDMALAFQEGRLKRNFQGYTTDQASTLIGLGASSISRLPAGYVQNYSGVNEWRTRILEGRLPAARGVSFTPEDHLNGAVIEALMCYGWVDLDQICHGLGADPASLDAAWRPLVEFERDGLVTLKGSIVALTEAGEPLVRTVCTAFDRYLAPDAARHAAAV